MRTLVDFIPTSVDDLLTDDERVRAVSAGWNGQEPEMSQTSWVTQPGVGATGVR